MDRGSGILMHISSLPNAYGIGTLGKEAYSFIDFLKKFSVLYFILSTIVTAVNMIIVIINAKIINSAADS